MLSQGEISIILYKEKLPMNFISNSVIIENKFECYIFYDQSHGEVDLYGITVPNSNLFSLVVKLILICCAKSLTCVNLCYSNRIYVLLKFLKYHFIEMKLHVYLIELGSTFS